MAFDPERWLATGAVLMNAGDEASLRAAAGRWYYGVWLKSLLSLEHDGLLQRRGSRDDHSAVVRVLHARRRASAGSALERLARLREWADYDTARAFTLVEARRADYWANEVARLLAPDWARVPR